MSPLPGDAASAAVASAERLESLRRLAEAEPFDLFEAALVVSQIVEPDEDLDAARHAVAELAGRVTLRTAAGLKPHAALVEVLFEQEGFRGDEEDYDQPSNSSVARVLARKRGLPLTLSLVAMEVGRLAGLRLTGVGLPGHFVVGGPDLPDGMYLDAFDAGMLYEAGGLSRRLAAIFGQPVAVGAEILRPDPPKAILARMLLNLRRSYERRDRYEEALETLRGAEILEPDDEDLKRERGLLLLKCGQTEEALAALEEYAETAEGDDAEPVLRLIEAVRARAVSEAEEDGEADGESAPPRERRVFTLDEARALFPRVQELTAAAVSRYAQLSGNLEEARQEIVREWAEEILGMGLEIKGLWLVDWDSGAGYYCWKYPEPGLAHFHSYEEGFSGRVPLA